MMALLEAEGLPALKRPDVDRARLRDVAAMTRGHRRWIAVGVALTAGGSALTLAQPLVVKDVIEAADPGGVPW